MICYSDGFAYRRQRIYDGTEYWHCRRYRSYPHCCSARAIRDLRSGQFFVTAPHSCDRADFCLSTAIQDGQPVLI